MTKFDDMLSIRRQITIMDNRLNELSDEMYAPRISRITGMPHGGGNNSTAIENNIVQKERVENRKKKLTLKLNRLWRYVYSLMKYSNISSADIRLMQLRFYFGLSWKRCIKIMNTEYADWNENKIFRSYRNVLEKCTKNEINFVYYANRNKV